MQHFCFNIGFTNYSFVIEACTTICFEHICFRNSPLLRNEALSPLINFACEDVFEEIRCVGPGSLCWSHDLWVGPGSLCWSQDLSVGHGILVLVPVSLCWSPDVCVGPGMFVLVPESLCWSRDLCVPWTNTKIRGPSQRSWDQHKIPRTNTRSILICKQLSNTLTGLYG